MNDKLNSANQSLTPGDLVELFILDLSRVGAGAQYFTNSVQNATGPAGLTFGGVFYQAVDFKSEGWEYNGQGPFPRPKLSISNVKGMLSELLYAHQDLVGCKITRIRTYAQFLDGMPEEDSDVMFPPDIYQVFQKQKHDRKEIIFELAAHADQEGQTVPARKILRDTCTRTYRHMTPSGFDYTDVTCPYAGTTYFDEQGNVTLDPYQDKCNFQLKTGCQKRFGKQNLPSWAFPGVVRVRF